MQEGYEAYLLLVIQMKGVDRFEPNWETHREFGETLQEAEKAGVHILAYDCLVEPDRMEIQDSVPVCLTSERASSLLRRCPSGFGTCMSYF